MIDTDTRKLFSAFSHWKGNLTFNLGRWPYTAAAVRYTQTKRRVRTDREARRARSHASEAASRRSASSRIKSHLSEILRGKGSPTVTTLAKLARALTVEMRELFTFPERGTRDRAIDLLSTAKPEIVRRVLRLLAAERDEP